MADDGFPSVYQRYGPPVHQFVARMLGDAATADEVTQDTFVRYLQHEDALRGRNGHVAPWLYRVATNLSLDRMRKMRPGPLEGESSIAAPAPHDVDADEKARVRWAVAKLEPDLRATFLLRAHHGLTFPQIALVLDVSERGAKDRFRRARDRLVELLAPYFPERMEPKQ